jgi:hypothetical protein
VKGAREVMVEDEGVVRRKKREEKEEKEEGKEERGGGRIRTGRGGSERWKCVCGQDLGECGADGTRTDRDLRPRMTTLAEQMRRRGQSALERA